MRSQQLIPGLQCNKAKARVSFYNGTLVVYCCYVKLTVY